MPWGDFMLLTVYIIRPGGPEASFFFGGKFVTDWRGNKHIHTWTLYFPPLSMRYTPSHPCIQENKTFNQSTQSIFVLDKEQKVSTTVLDQVSTTETRDCEVKFPSTLGLSTKWLLKREKNFKIKRIWTLTFSNWIKLSFPSFYYLINTVKDFTKGNCIEYTHLCGLHLVLHLTTSTLQ